MAQKKRGRPPASSKKKNTSASQRGAGASGSSGSSSGASGTGYSSGASASGGASSRTSGTSGAGSRTSGAGGGSPNPPRRREIAAVICLFLCVFSFIGYFDAEPIFISFFTGFVKRLIGPGFFALPPALLMCAVVLGFHKGYPVMLRVISTLSITVVVGILAHTFLYAVTLPDGKFVISFSVVGGFWLNGAELQSGGIIAGSISQLFLVLFGKVGTVITLIIATALLGMIAFNATISGLLVAFGNRERRNYEREPEIGMATYGDGNAQVGIAPDSDTRSNAAQIAYREERSRKYRYPLIPLWRRKKIDIPLEESKSLGEDYFPDDPLDELYRKTPVGKTHEDTSNDTPPWETSVKGNGHGADSDGAHGSVEYGIDPPIKGAREDMPLDIPFMDGRIKRPPPVVPPIIEERFMTNNDPSNARGSAFSSGDNRVDDFGEQAKPKKRSMPNVPLPEGADGSGDGAGAGGTDTSGGGADTYVFPPIELLSRGDPHSKAGDSEVNLNSERLEAAFQSFGINVNISNMVRGPSVTRYEAELEAGIKLSRLTSLSDDIALALGTIGVRIAAMPNKISTVGIEVPNKNISRVHLRDVIDTQTFSRSPSKLTFAIGMDISGQPIVGEISKLPHMLVAGTTGSGKSVCLNSLILSILYKASPKDVRFIMLDPKMVEFKVYNNIPHLLVPVVTDVRKAAGALQWATFEMMKRYSLFSETNSRDIEGYNNYAKKSNEEVQPLPQVVIVIDELADLMMMAAKEVEESVCRIAQMGRAAGIHLIIATQSPRANVITGLMKANIPSRIAFKVASALESQIILDPGQNADKLVGNGDMLYSPTGSAKPMRLQGTWVSDKEREKVVNFINKSSETQYSEEVIYEIEKAADKSSGSSGGGSSGGSADTESDYDELFPQAVDVLFEAGQGQASVSLLQRRLKLGYARAARIVDQMEEMGVVGPYEGSKPRTLLITKDQWRQMQYSNGDVPTN